VGRIASSFLPGLFRVNQPEIMQNANVIRITSRTPIRSQYCAFAARGHLAVRDFARILASQENLARRMAFSIFVSLLWRILLSNERLG
jgi:hypothetical protein